MNNHLTILVAMLALLVPAVSAHGQDPVDSPRRPLRPVMQLKLDYSKQVLEGLALEDYKKIAKSSQKLGLLSLESGWKMLQTEEYVKQSLEFRRTANVITEAARDNNLERAALGYVALTVRCIECHGYLRKQHPELSLDVQRGESAPAKATPKK
jgi:hypothetical protein